MLSPHHALPIARVDNLLRLLLRRLPRLHLLNNLVRLRSKAVIPPPERGSIVSNKLLVMHIVMIGARPEGEEVSQRPREVISRVRIDRLEETEHDPGVHGDDVEVSRHCAPQNGDTDGAEAEREDFDGRGEFSGHAEGRRVLVVQLVDGLVERGPVEGAVEPVVPGVLEDKEDGDLVGDGGPGGEGGGNRNAKVLAHGVEGPDLGELNGKVLEEDEEETFELLFGVEGVVLWGC